MPVLSDADSLLNFTAADMLTFYGGTTPPASDPKISTLTPNTGVTGIPITVTVTGTGFVSGAVAEATGPDLPTTFVSATTLTVAYTPGTVGTVQFTVRNPDAMQSNGSPFTVTASA